MRPYALLMIVCVGVVAAIAAAGGAFADEAFSVVIDGRTGQAFLRNDGSSTVQFDGYLLRSPQVDAFDPDSWSSLQNNPATPGWSESMAAPNRLGEANLFGSTSVGTGQSIGIGSPYAAFDPTTIGQQEPGLNSLDFTYSLASGGSFVGDIEFINRNTVVLVVDPITGDASLQNQSEFDINIDSYLIRSIPEVLNVDAWTPLAESLVGAGWVAAGGAINRIAEGNLFGSTFLAANGGSLPLGSPIDPNLLNDETDLELEFNVTSVGTVVGGVLFESDVAPPAVPGDYSGNGVVDAADYAVWRNRLNQSFALTNENPDAMTPGVVDQEDYSFWKSRFGATTGSGSGGLAGVAAATHTVPEPCAGLMTVVCGLGLVVGSRRRGCRRRTPPEFDPR